jgi:hypothetical protein
MKTFNRLTLALLLGTCGIGTQNLTAAQADNIQPGAATAQRRFASPEDAVNALRAAADADDHSAFVAIFGSEVNDLLTTDKTQDANNARRFAAALAQRCTPVKDGDDKIILEVGTNDWPMAVPLVKEGSQWRFDTDAGKEEIINRHIGKDELHAVGVCRAYVTAQKQFAAEPANAGNYALRFKSTSGKKDGLYWAPEPNEPVSPFGPLVAEALSEGYGYRSGANLHPFHGYYFKILTRQGDAAPGGKTDYLTHGRLTRGFALVAYPERWDQSGIMTFIVNQDGKVFQQNLGEHTSHIAGSMKEYNPDSQWAPVEDEGVTSAVSEK